MITLAKAAAKLGISPRTLRHQAARGRLRATLVGKTYVTTEAAIEAYRRDRLGRPGRKKGQTRHDYS